MGLLKKIHEKVRHKLVVADEMKLLRRVGILDDASWKWCARHYNLKRDPKDIKEKKKC
jgi:hypothetical protein